MEINIKEPKPLFFSDLDPGDVFSTFVNWDKKIHYYMKINPDGSDSRRTVIDLEDGCLHYIDSTQKVKYIDAILVERKDTNEH